MDIENLWKGILSAVIFAMQIMIHTMLGAKPMQLVFGQDAILDILYKANW